MVSMDEISALGDEQSYMYDPPPENEKKKKKKKKVSLISSNTVKYGHTVLTHHMFCRKRRRSIRKRSVLEVVLFFGFYYNVISHEQCNTVDTS